MLGIPLTPDSLIFSRYDGSPLLPNTVTRAYLRIARSVGITNVRFHDLRHTHATWMMKAGIHPKVVQERLGHFNIGITLDTYSHVIPGLQEKAALAFDELIDESRSQATPSTIGQQL